VLSFPANVEEPVAQSHRCSVWHTRRRQPGAGEYRPKTSPTANNKVVKLHGEAHVILHGQRLGGMGGPCCTVNQAIWSTRISVPAGCGGWATGRLRLDGIVWISYAPDRPAKSSIPRTLVMVMLFAKLRIISVVVVIAAFRPAIAQNDPLAVDIPRATDLSGPSSEFDPCRRWWLPGDPGYGKKCRTPSNFATCDHEFDERSSTSPRTMIEEAESLLDAPRFDCPRFFVNHSIDQVDGLRPSGDQFSRAWSDGAPLLLFDWSGKSRDPWAPPSLRQEGVQRVAGVNAASDFADLTAKVKLRERDAQLDPSGRSAWETDQTVKVPVAGSMFVFNQVTGSTPDVDQHQYKWLGKTGVGLKLKPWLLQELQLRTGPAVRYDDTTTLSKGQSPERSELFVEAVTKVPVPVVGPVNVEYSTYAVPAATSADRNQINQDVRFALPFSSGQFHVGAKYKWEAASATPWMDRMQVYMGVQNKW
jgi:hypothetical protein